MAAEHLLERAAAICILRHRGGELVGATLRRIFAGGCCGMPRRREVRIAARFHQSARDLLLNTDLPLVAGRARHGPACLVPPGPPGYNLIREWEARGRGYAGDSRRLRRCRLRFRFRSEGSAPGAGAASGFDLPLEPLFTPLEDRLALYTDQFLVGPPALSTMSRRCSMSTALWRVTWNFESGLPNTSRACA